MGKTVEMKRKKKGRPSLLDLQKRSLRLQQQQQQQQKKRNPNPNPNPNPYLRFPSNGSCRRSTRRNPISDPLAEVQDDGEGEEGNIRKRREKKLKLVLRIHDHSENSPRHSGPSGSESEGEVSGSRRKRKIEAVGGDGDRSKADMHSSLKATESLRAETSNSGPTTPLPDKKLLLFILDMLQKKDTYGVFSEPVDPEELPGYLEVIEHPMDFSTIRKKLSHGAYKNLEQFEKDVFLISSNAMRYNAPYTIYYRQARSIQDLAKKNFENLRQESDREPETKTVARRGRPPSKNRPVGLLPTELTPSGFSSENTLANTGCGANFSSQSHPLLKKGSATDKPGLTDVSGKFSYDLRNSDSFGWINMNKVNAGEELPGSAKGITTRFGKKNPVMEENRRNNDSQLRPYSYGCELPIWSLVDAEKKQLAPVGLHMEYAYARSLARFAAHLGSIGWAIAAKRIEKSLPPGTKFGAGWVGENEAPQHSQTKIQPAASPSYQSSQLLISPCTNNNPSQKLQPSEGIGKSTAVVSAPCDGGSSDHRENSEGQLAILNSGAGNETVIQPKTAFQVHQNRGMQPTANGFTSGFRFNLPSQVGNVMRPPMSFGSEPPVTHTRTLDTAPRNSRNGNTLIQTHSTHFDSKMAVTCNTPISFRKPMPDNGNDSQWRGFSMQGKLESISPDLNFRFQPPGSPASGAVVDSQQPDLALQL